MSGDYVLHPDHPRARYNYQHDAMCDATDKVWAQQADGSWECMDCRRIQAIREDQAINIEHPCDSVPVAVDCKCYIAGAADFQEAHGGFYRRGLEDARMAVINRMLEDGWDEMTTACVASAINPLVGES